MLHTFRFTSFIIFLGTSPKTELDLTHIDIYTLGAQCCRQKIQEGGVGSFVQNNLQFTVINLDSCSVDKVIEVCALQLDNNLLNICVLVIYRSLTIKYKNFLTQLHMILQSCIQYIKIQLCNMW